MARFANLFRIFLCLFCAGCQYGAPPQRFGTTGAKQPITITAQSGSEVVLHKYAGLPNSPLPVSPLPAATAQTDQPAFLSGYQAGPSDAIASYPLGGLQNLPWITRPGETLTETLQRFVQREGYTFQRPNPYPVWEIQAQATFDGVFEDALQWLMQGFSHVSPRPVLTLHPNRVLRLNTE